MFPLGDEGLSVVVVARLEKKTCDDGEECTDEDGDEKAFHFVKASRPGGLSYVGNPRCGRITARFWIVRVRDARVSGYNVYRKLVHYDECR